MVEARPYLADLLGKRRVLPDVEVLDQDLLHLSFTFVNVRVARGGALPVLKRLAANEPGFLVVDVHPQHATELALYEVADGIKLAHPRPPDGVAPSDAPKDPDIPEDPKAPPKAGDPLQAPPICASLAGTSRLVFKVENEAIPYSVEGLLGALGTLELSVAPHATPPAPGFPGIRELFEADLVGSVATVFERAGGPTARIVRGRRRVDSPPGGTRVAAELIAVGRVRATTATLEHRFGTDAALGALRATSVGARLGVAHRLEEFDFGDLLVPNPVPAPASPTETSIELPWRLQISPNEHGAFAHSLVPVEHEGRYELWHTRLGVRDEDDQGNPVVEEGEKKKELRTIRAIWARDFDRHGFTEEPDGGDFPAAGGKQDVPAYRKALNSRDRMMLVHQTSNFRLRRQHRPWTPEAVPTNRLMLTALGGWLDSRVFFDTLPDGGLTIEEWKHRAALGRDHEVKVVYSGFLLPFGHKASLIKLTQRKLKLGLGGRAAYLFQRMFIAVREPERTFREDEEPYDGDGRRLDLTMPFGSVRILTSVTPDLDEPESLLEVADDEGGHIFEPHVLDEPFLFDLVAVDLEGNMVEFAAPLTFMERDRNLPDRLGTAAASYNARAHRDLNLRGQRIAYAASQRADDTTLSTQSTTFNVVLPPSLENDPQDKPRFAPMLESARAVVPAMSALAGDEKPVKLEYPLHYAANGFEDNAAQVFLAKSAGAAAKLSFAGQDRPLRRTGRPERGRDGALARHRPDRRQRRCGRRRRADFDVGSFFPGVSGEALRGDSAQQAVRHGAVQPRAPTEVRDAGAQTSRRC